MALRSRIYMLVALLAIGGVLLTLALWGGQGEEAGGGHKTKEQSADPSRGLSGEDQNVEPANNEPTPLAVETLYNFDASDTRQLVGYSNAVFSGKTVGLVGEKPLTSTIPNDPGQPQQQWEVEVSEVFKGEGLRGLSSGARVVINVSGGTDPKTGEPVVVASAGSTPPATDEPMVQGGSYVFAARDNRRAGWLEISAQPFGKVPVESREKYESVRTEFLTALEDPIDPLANPSATD